MRCYAQLENSPYAWQYEREQYHVHAQNHLKSSHAHVGIGIKHV
jgi:hypothetical protein